MKRVSLAEKASIIAIMAIGSGALSAWLNLDLWSAALVGLVAGIAAFGIIGLLVWGRR